MVKMKLKSSIEQLKRNNGLRYILSIGATSGFTIIKGFVLAVLLSSHVYGQYVSLYAICIFMGTTLSFGNIESTIKTYPRYHVDGKHKEILIDILAIVRILCIRSLILIPIMVTIVWYLTRDLDTITIIACWLLTLTTAVFTVISSGIRATGLLLYIGNIQFVRSLISFTVVVLIAKIFNHVPFIFFAEAIASTVSIVLSIKSLIKSLELQRTKLSSYVKNQSPISHFKEGLPLFFSYILVAIPTFFDKSIIGSSIGFALAGTYGVLSVINQAGTLISNIIVQRAGPQIIKIVKQSKNLKAANAYFIKWISIFSVIQFLLILGVFVLYCIPYFYTFFAKYNIKNSSIFLMGAISILQAKSFMEFFFIAYDKEKIIFKNALIYVLLFVLFFAFVIFMKLDFNSFLIAILGAKLLQMLLLIFDYLKLIKAPILVAK